MATKTFFGPAIALIIAFSVMVAFHQTANAQACAFDCGSGSGSLPPASPPPGGGGSGGGIKPKSIPPGRTETCPDDRIDLGDISATAVKTAPLFPLVIGQDDTKRGADLSCRVSVAPTTVTSWTHNSKGNCVKHVQTFPETIKWSLFSANLSPASREWILNGDLQIHYPGAYLHNPDMALGSCNGLINAQIADPGEFFLNISGQTSGTAVHAARNFSFRGGSFIAYLREVIITK